MKKAKTKPEKQKLVFSKFCQCGDGYSPNTRIKGTDARRCQRCGKFPELTEQEKQVFYSRTHR